MHADLASRSATAPVPATGPARSVVSRGRAAGARRVDRVQGMGTARRAARTAAWKGAARRLGLACAVALGASLAYTPSLAAQQSADLDPLEEVAAGPRIGLDARAGTVANTSLAAGSRFEGLRQHLAARGHATRPVSVFEAERLANLDLLVLQQPTGPALRLRSAERGALHAFVARGGHLIVLGEVGGRSDQELADWNGWLAPYGVQFGPAERPASGARRVEALLTHPITRGVGALDVQGLRRSLSVRTPALDLTGGGGLDDVLALVERPGAGTLAILGDASIWTGPAGARNQAAPADRNPSGIAARGNRVLLDNLLTQFVGAPAQDDAGDGSRGEPVDALGLSVQLGGLRDSWLGLPARAAEVLQLLIPEGASSGRYVELSVGGAQPGAMLLVLLGEAGQEGATSLRSPQLLTTAAADPDGRAKVSVLVPSSAAGHLFGLRLVDPVSGETSDVIRFVPQRSGTRER